MRALFKLQTGEVYRESRVKKGYEKLRDIYGAQGYFQWTSLTKRVPDAERRVVDVTLTMEEDKRYYVGQIHFTGNHSTRDKVIRREVFLNETDVFNTEALKLSIRRINQLGYFKPMEAPPALGPSKQGDDHIDVTFKVEEQNRNQFTLGGGVSGLDGTFANASFQTNNFLGAGETLTLAAQKGGRSNNYQLAVSEPYLFDRPITAGVDLFSRKNDYLTAANLLAYSQVRTGSTVSAGVPLRRFTRLFGSYTYEVIDTAVREDLASTGHDVGRRCPYSTRSPTRAAAARAASAPRSCTTRSTTPTRRAAASASRAPSRWRAASWAAACRTGSRRSKASGTSRTPSARPWACAARSATSAPTGTRSRCPTTSASSWAARRRSAA